MAMSLAFVLFNVFLAFRKCNFSLFFFIFFITIVRWEQIKMVKLYYLFFEYIKTSSAWSLLAKLGGNCVKNVINFSPPTDGLGKI